MKRWIILTVLISLYCIFQISYEAKYQLLEKDRIIEEKQNEMIAANERIAVTQEENKKYQRVITDIILWAQDMFPWGAGGALEHLTATDIEDLNLEDEIRKLPLSIPEAEQRVRFMERIKKWPLMEYNYVFASIGWGYPVLYPEKSYVSEEFVKYYRVRTNGRYYSGPHPGVDIVSPWESSANSVDVGLVTFVHIEPLFRDLIDEHPLELYEKGMGSYVVIEHEIPNDEKAYSVYGHLTQVLVEVGDRVEKGQIIGIMESTGISQSRHMHFEVRKYVTKKRFARLNPFTNSLQGNVVYTTFLNGNFE